MQEVLDTTKNLIESEKSPNQRAQELKAELIKDGYDMRELTTYLSKKGLVVRDERAFELCQLELKLTGKEPQVARIEIKSDFVGLSSPDLTIVKTSDGKVDTAKTLDRSGFEIYVISMTEKPVDVKNFDRVDQIIRDDWKRTGRKAVVYVDPEIKLKSRLQDDLPTWQPKRK